MESGNRLSSLTETYHQQMSHKLNLDISVLVPSKGYPPFRINESRFSQATFYGRWRHFLEVIDPTTLLTTDEKLKESCELLERYKRGDVLPHITDGDMWRAQKIKQAIIHPDTGEKIFMPFRMSGFVPFGTPMVVGMLLPNPSFAQTIFWQWLNQSHNACVNYANRNASKPTSMKNFVIGYIGAVTCAVGIAVGLTSSIAQISFLSQPTKMLIKRFIPFPAVASASTCNVVLMRYSELSTGIEVFDANHTILGTSTVAAKKALLETAMSRVVLASPILILPPIVMRMFEKTAFLKKYPRMHLPINSLVCTLVFGGALPFAIAVFPKSLRLNEANSSPVYKKQRLKTVSTITRVYETSQAAYLGV